LYEEPNKLVYRQKSAAQYGRRGSFWRRVYIYRHHEKLWGTLSGVDQIRNNNKSHT